MKIEFEILNLAGFRILDATEKAPVLLFSFGFGSTRAARLPFVGDTHKRWMIAVEVLPDLTEHTVFSDAKGIQTRFRYFYEFWQRHTKENKPFIFVNPNDSRRWLVAFTETEMSYEFLTAKVMSQKGIEIEQRIERGVSYLDDGSLSGTIGPDEI